MFKTKQVSAALWLLVLILLPMGFGGSTLGAPGQVPQGAPHPNAGPFSGDLYITSFIDVLPPYTAQALALCNQYAAASRHDAGLVRFEVLAQANGRENHMMLFIVWKTQKDYETNMGQPYTKMFRERLQQYLGAPYDERMSHMVLAQVTPK